MPIHLDQSDAPTQSKRYLSLQIALFALAAILIGRAIPFQSYNQKLASQYESWGAPMPYQARCLMVPVLHWAVVSPFMHRAAAALSASAYGPDQLMMQIIDVLCLFAAGALTVRLRNCFTPARLFPWLAPLLVLWAAGCTYAMRYEQRFSLPYDLPALVFFTLGLLACIEYRPALLLLAIVVGTYNRETTIFLVPIWLTCNWARSRVQVFTTAILGGLIWIAVKLQIRHWLHNAPFGLVWPLDLHMLLPHHWAQDASIAGFLIWPILIFYRLVHAHLLRKVWLGCIPYFAAAVLFGWWNETRIFGEIIPLAAVTAAIQFEQYIRDRVPTLKITSQQR